MKTKEVEIDGQKFTISPLCIEQVDAISEAQVNGSADSLKQRSRQTVCDALNNPTRPDDPATEFNPPYSIARIVRQLDLSTFHALHNAILEYSGLVAKPGESAAAPGSESTSPTSEVA